MTDRIGVSKSSPSTSFWLEADVVAFNAAGGTATVRCYLRAANGPSGSSASQFGGTGFQAGYIDGSTEFGRHSGNPFLPSGYSQNAQRWRDGAFDVAVAMSTARTVGLSMWLRYGSIDEWFGGSIYIPWTPGAPNPVGVDQITPTSARYRFSGTTDNGSAITGWQAQIATNAAFTTGVQTVSSSGTTTFADLTPATLYYFRSRGSNGIGWGAWSSAISATTASGAYASINGIWVPVPAYAGNSTALVVPELLISDGTAWRAAI